MAVCEVKCIRSVGPSVWRSILYQTRQVKSFYKIFVVVVIALFLSLYAPYIRLYKDVSVQRLLRITRPSGQRCVLKHFWAYDMMQAKGTFATHLGHKIISSLSHICTFLFISFSIRRHLMKKLMQNLFHSNTTQ